MYKEADRTFSISSLLMQTVIPSNHFIFII